VVVADLPAVLDRQVSAPDFMPPMTTRNPGRTYIIYEVSCFNAFL